MDYHTMEATSGYTHYRHHAMHNRSGVRRSVGLSRRAEWEPSGLEHHTSVRLSASNLVHESARCHVSE
jgi:hypothetical protein